MEKGKNGEKFKCKTSGSWWLWGGQQANYHTCPPIQLSLIVRPHADCKNKQGSWIVVKFWESFSLDCLFCKNIFENFAFFLFPQLRVLYPNILQNPPSIPDWGFPLSPLVGDCVGKLFWPFHTWYFHTFSDILYNFVFNKSRKSSIVIDSPASFLSDCTVKLFWSSHSYLILSGVKNLVNVSHTNNLNWWKDFVHCTI